MPVELAAKHHVAVFTTRNLCKYTGTNTQCKPAPSLAVLRSTYTQLNPGMCVFSSRSHLRVVLHRLTANFCHIFSQIGWHHIRVSLSLSLFLQTGTRLRAFVSKEHSVSGFHGALILKEKHCCHSVLLPIYCCLCVVASNCDAMYARRIFFFSPSFPSRPSRQTEHAYRKDFLVQTSISSCGFQVIDWKQSVM